MSSPKGMVLQGAIRSRHANMRHVNASVFVTGDGVLVVLYSVGDTDRTTHIRTFGGWVGGWVGATTCSKEKRRNATEEVAPFFILSVFPRETLYLTQKLIFGGHAKVLNSTRDEQSHRLNCKTEIKKNVSHG